MIPRPDRPELLSGTWPLSNEVWIAGARRFTMLEAPAEALMRRWISFPRRSLHRENPPTAGIVGVRLIELEVTNLQTTIACS